MIRYLQNRKKWLVFYNGVELALTDSYLDAQLILKRMKKRLLRYDPDTFDWRDEHEVPAGYGRRTG